jgi:hypothetical protein
MKTIAKITTGGNEEDTKKGGIYKEDWRGEICVLILSLTQF